MRLSFLLQFTNRRAKDFFEKTLLDQPVHNAVVDDFGKIKLLQLGLRLTLPLHGGLRESARLRALRAFEEKRTRLLIATNVAARGLDLSNISHVINFDMPEDIETYVHRVGRTARMGRAGTAITFVGQYDIEMFEQLRKKFGETLKRHPLNIYA